eukprot:gene1412-3466_t
MSLRTLRCPDCADTRVERVCLVQCPPSADDGGLPFLLLRVLACDAHANARLRRGSFAWKSPLNKDIDEFIDTHGVHSRNAPRKLMEKLQKEFPEERLTFDIAKLRSRLGMKRKELEKWIDELLDSIRAEPLTDTSALVVRGTDLDSSLFKPAAPRERKDYILVTYLKLLRAA